MKENINYKILYRILRQYSYNRNMEAMNILYKELVLEGVIPEFKFNMEVWKNDKSGKNVWKWYQEGILDIEWEEPMLIILGTDIHIYTGNPSVLGGISSVDMYISTLYY